MTTWQKPPYATGWHREALPGVNYTVESFLQRNGAEVEARVEAMLPTYERAYAEREYLYLQPSFSRGRILSIYRNAPSGQTKLA